MRHIARIASAAKPNCRFWPSLRDFYGQFLCFQPSAPINLSVSIKMNLIRLSLALICPLVIGGCAIAKFRISPDDIFDGTAFWVYPAFLDYEPYSFYWYGDAVFIHEPYGNSFKEYTITLNACPPLRPALAELEKSIHDSTEILTGRLASASEDRIVLDGPVFKLKHAPSKLMSSMVITSYADQDLPWVSKALIAQKVAHTCSES